MAGLHLIKKYVFPLDTIVEAYSLMRYAGSKGVEGMSLFAGVIDADSFQVKQTIIPQQTGYIMEQGLLYSVSGDELYRINKHLFESKLMLGAQIHSHPGRAYHSETDDAFPIVTVVGGLSIVIPNFAKGPIDMRDWAVYRLSLDNQWISLSYEKVCECITIIQ